jgi:hypothetical protein
MKFEIKSRITGDVLFSIEKTSLRLAVEAAAKSGASLYGADLSGASLYGADLSGANLSEAKLSGANLSGANLSGANLSEANLSGAHLSGAKLYGAKLYEADLYGANLSGANLSEASLCGADLYGANLSGANLYGAHLSGANLSPLQLAELSILSEGPLFGWKKCRDGVLVRLFIPSRARRSNSTGRKCRAERAKVLEVIGAEKGISQYDGTTVYEVGKWVYCDKWNEDRWVECGGIHFFITRTEAEAY